MPPRKSSDQFRTETHIRVNMALKNYSNDRKKAIRDRLSQWFRERPLRPWELDEEEYVIECIMACRKSPFGEYYLIKWEGYPISQSTWESRKKLPDTLVEKFHTQLLG